MKKMIILSCLAFITLSALGLNAYLKGAKKTNTLSTAPTQTEEVTEEFVEPEIELKETEQKKELKKEAPQVEKKKVSPKVDKKQIEKKVVESDIPPIREVLAADADDSAVAVADKIEDLKEIEEVPELAIEHFGRASLKQPREKQLTKKDKLTAKVSKKEKRKKRKKMRK